MRQFEILSPTPWDSSIDSFKRDSHMTKSFSHQVNTQASPFPGATSPIRPHTACASKYTSNFLSTPSPSSTFACSASGSKWTIPTAAILNFSCLGSCFTMYVMCALHVDPHFHGICIHVRLPQQQKQESERGHRNQWPRASCFEVRGSKSWRTAIQSASISIFSASNN